MNTNSQVSHLFKLKLKLPETEKIIVIGKGAFASAVLAKHNEEQVVLKDSLCKHWDEERKKFLEEVNILTIACQYTNFLDVTGTSYARN